MFVFCEKLIKANWKRVINLEEIKEQEINLDNVYGYAGFPDKVSGRCDNCNSPYFKSSVKGGVFLCECRDCGMKKSI
jgi:hypothetical protein